MIAVAAGGGGGLFHEVSERSKQGLRGHPRTGEDADDKAGHLLLSLCSAVMGIAPLQAAGAEAISVALSNSKHEKATSWQRGNGQKYAAVFAVAA